jgi:hypothetical protein
MCLFFFASILICLKFILDGKSICIILLHALTGYGDDDAKARINIPLLPPKISVCLVSCAAFQILIDIYMWSTTRNMWWAVTTSKLVVQPNYSPFPFRDRIVLGRRNHPSCRFPSPPPADAHAPRNATWINVLIKFGVCAGMPSQRWI